MTQYEKMTQTPVQKLIATLALPTIVSMLVTNFYNMVDNAFIGTLGTSQSGAVGVVFGYMALLQAIGFMFGQGSGSIISRAMGEQDEERASETASTGFFMSLSFAVVAAVLSAFFLDPIISVLGSTDTIAPYAKTYIVFILATAPFMVTSFTLNNILRYEGKAYLGMIGLLTGAVLNIGGDALFMFGLHMGIAGAGLSTALSQTVSFGILLSMFVAGRTRCVISIKRVRVRRYLGNIALTGLPSLLRQGLNSTATIILNNVVNVYGDAAVAGMSIASRLFFFVFSIAVGVGQGFQPVSGFNYGAKKYGRLRKGYFFTMAMAEALMLALMVVLMCNTVPIVTLFRDDPDVITVATRAIRLQCISAVFMPVTMVTEMLMQSTGHKVGASILSAVRSGLFFIPLLIVMSRWRGLYGIEEAQPISNIISLIPGLICAVLFWHKVPKTDQE